MTNYCYEGTQIGIYIPDLPKLIRYNEYLFFLQSNDKQTAITLAAERTKCAESTIYRAIEFFADSCENYNS